MMMSSSLSLSGGAAGANTGMLGALTGRGGVGRAGRGAGGTQTARCAWAVSLECERAVSTV